MERLKALPRFLPNHVQVTNEAITERLIPQAGYTEIQSEHLSVYLPSEWQERKYSDVVAYYDDVDRNSFSIIYENQKDLDSLPKFSVIQNANVTSAKLISYMGHAMLVMEEQENGNFVYSYLFNTDGMTVTMTLTFTSQEADVHDEIFYSLLIYEEPYGGEV